MSKRAYTEDFDQFSSSTNQKADDASFCKRSKHSAYGKQIVEISSDESINSGNMADVDSDEDNKREKPVMHDRSKSKVFDSEMPQLQAAKAGWVIYAVHPDKGQFVVNEGINLVGEEEIVSGGVRQGFFASPVPATHRHKIRANERLGHPHDTVVFPNLLMLAPPLRRLAESAFDLSMGDVGEVTAYFDMQADVVLPWPSI